MSALFVPPVPFTVVAASAEGRPAAYLNRDEPTLVWRSTNLSSVYIIVDMAGAAYDTLSLIGCNTTSAHNIRFRTGDTASGIGAYDSGIVAAGNGAADLETGRLTVIHRLPTVRSERYLRIDFGSQVTGTGYIEASRLVIGKALPLTENAGVNSGIEQSFVDQSVTASGNGWTTTREFEVLAQCKLVISAQPDADWRGAWFSFLQKHGKKRAFLMVLDGLSPLNWQVESIFGKLVADPITIVTSYGQRRTEMTIRALAQ